MSSLLPKHNGALPYWILATSAASLFNTIGCYTSPSRMRRTYSGPTSQSQVTDLSIRLFGTWTLVSFILRTYTAYNIENKEIYIVTLWTYVIALSHFLSEWLVFETMSIRKGILPSLVVATVSIGWMAKECMYYVGK